jgi:DNA-binding PadR family transcriptional regulator
MALTKSDDGSQAAPGGPPLGGVGDDGEEPTGGCVDDGSHRGHGPHGSKHHGRRGGGRGRRRAQRGDVRTAILLLLADQPMHGYQLMQAMNERTNGVWRPSPGAVYPTIDQLEDEGLATIQQEGGRRLVTLTAEGQAHLAEHGTELSDPFTEFAGGADGRDLRDPMDEVQAAARQVEVSGTTAQVEAAAQVLGQARRSLYLILAGESDDAGE